MIQLKNVTKYYGNSENRFQVLKNISLSIHEGSFAVILGASGSGKSTLLSVMSALERPDSGQVLWDDTDIAILSDSARTKLRGEHVGFIFQQYYLLPHMNVDKNVKMGADLVKNTSYREVIRAVGLEGKLQKYPSELSGGEQQRVAVARALAKKPKLLFLDEPTGALDEATGRQVLNYISTLQSTYGFTAIMVTHNQNIAAMADTVIQMNSGSISDIYANRQKLSAYKIGW